MKRLVLAMVATFTLASLVTSALGAPPAADSTRPAAQARGVNLSGRVSADAKVLVTDDDSAWFVSNADTLNGFENLYVTVKCRMDLKKGAIRVLSVVEPATSRRSHLSDAAFRR